MEKVRKLSSAELAQRVVMEVLECLESEKHQRDKVAELLKLKHSLQQQVTEAKTREIELRDSCRDTVSSGEQPQDGLHALLDTYRLLGVSIKSLEQNLVLEFTPTFRNQSTSSESFISEIEIKKDSWQVVQHSFPPFIPVSQLVEDNSDLKVFIAALIDYGYAYVQRREALSFVKKTFSNYLQHDVEVNLPVTYIQIQLHQPHTKTSVAQITLHYDRLKSLPDSVDIKTDIAKIQLQRWQMWLRNEDLLTAMNSIVLDLT